MIRYQGGRLHYKRHIVPSGYLDFLHQTLLPLEFPSRLNDIIIHGLEVVRMLRGVEWMAASDFEFGKTYTLATNHKTFLGYVDEFR